MNNIVTHGDITSNIVSDKLNYFVEFAKQHNKILLVSDLPQAIVEADYFIFLDKDNLGDNGEYLFKNDKNLLFAYDMSKKQIVDADFSYYGNNISGCVTTADVLFFRNTDGTVVIDNKVFLPKHEILPPRETNNGRFGCSCDIDVDGTMLVVGDEIGELALYRKIDNYWNLVNQWETITLGGHWDYTMYTTPKYYKIENGTIGIDGTDIFVVENYGKLSIYKITTNDIVYLHKQIDPPDQNLDRDNAVDLYSGMIIDSTRLFYLMPDFERDFENEGAVFFFEKTNTEWEYNYKFMPTGAETVEWNDDWFFAKSGDISGDLGIFTDNREYGGATYYNIYGYHYDGTTWSQFQRFTIPEVDGNDISLRVALDGTRAFLTTRTSVSIYDYDGTVFNIVPELQINVNEVEIIQGIGLLNDKIVIATLDDKDLTTRLKFYKLISGNYELIKEDFIEDNFIDENLSNYALYDQRFVFKSKGNNLVIGVPDRLKNVTLSRTGKVLIYEDIDTTTNTLLDYTATVAISSESIMDSTIHCWDDNSSTTLTKIDNFEYPYPGFNNFHYTFEPNDTRHGIIDLEFDIPKNALVSHLQFHFETEMDNYYFCKPRGFILDSVDLNHVISPWDIKNINIANFDNINTYPYQTYNIPVEFHKNTQLISRHSTTYDNTSVAAMTPTPSNNLLYLDYQTLKLNVDENQKNIAQGVGYIYFDDDAPCQTGKFYLIPSNSVNISRSLVHDAGNKGYGRNYLNSSNIQPFTLNEYNKTTNPTKLSYFGESCGVLTTNTVKNPQETFIKIETHLNSRNFFYVLNDSIDDIMLVADKHYSFSYNTLYNTTDITTASLFGYYQRFKGDKPIYLINESIYNYTLTYPYFYEIRGIDYNNSKIIIDTTDNTLFNVSTSYLINSDNTNTFIYLDNITSLLNIFSWDATINTFQLDQTVLLDDSTIYMPDQTDYPSGNCIIPLMTNTYYSEKWDATCIENNYLVKYMPFYLKRKSDIRLYGGGRQYQYLKYGVWDTSFFGNYNYDWSNFISYSENNYLTLEAGMHTLCVRQYYQGTAYDQQPFSEEIEILKEYADEYSSDMNGNRLIIGNPYYNNNIGIVYIFEKTGDTWALDSTISGLSDLKNIGRVVSIDGTTCIFNVQNATTNNTRVLLFEKNLGVWSQIKELYPKNLPDYYTTTYPSAITIRNNWIFTTRNSSTSVSYINIYKKHEGSWVYWEYRQYGYKDTESSDYRNDIGKYFVKLDGTICYFSCFESGSDYINGFLAFELKDNDYWEHVKTVNVSQETANVTVGNVIDMNDNEISVLIDSNPSMIYIYDKETFAFTNIIYPNTPNAHYGEQMALVGDHYIFADDTNVYFTDKTTISVDDFSAKVNGLYFDVASQTFIDSTNYNTLSELKNLDATNWNKIKGHVNFEIQYDDIVGAEYNYTPLYRFEVIGSAANMKRYKNIPMKIPSNISYEIDYYMELENNTTFIIVPMIKHERYNFYDVEEQTFKLRKIHPHHWT